MFFCLDPNWGYFVMSVLFYGSHKSYLKFLLDPFDKKKSIPKLPPDLHCYLLSPKITSLLDMMEEAPYLFSGSLSYLQPTFSSHRKVMYYYACCTENTGLMTLFSLGYLCSLLLAPCSMATAANPLFRYFQWASVGYSLVWVVLAEIELGLLFHKAKLFLPSSIFREDIYITLSILPVLCIF